MRKLLGVLSVFSVLFAAGCGVVGGGSAPPPKGNFSNASLSGQYTYQFSGTDLSNPSSSVLYNRAGVFTADGNGNISNGTDDFSEGTAAISTATSGSYSIGNDGTGTLTLVFPSGSIQFAIAMVSSSTVYLIETDISLVGAGILERQSTSAFANLPSGTFVFRMHVIDSNVGSLSSVGAFKITSGTVSGNEDVNQAASFSSLTFAGGGLNPPDPVTGRGTGAFTDSNNVTTSFNYYIVDANNLRFFVTTPGQIGVGRAEMQSGGPFSNGSLAGSYAFGADGDTSSFFNSFHQVGRWAASNGTITAGALDATSDGVPATNISFGGTYSVAANGRTTVNIAPSGGGSAQQIYWLVNPSRAFLLTNSATVFAEGTVSQQQTSSFSNSTPVGQFGFFMHGFDFTPETVDRVGTLQWDGAGHLTLNELVNVSGAVNVPGFLPGTYSVAANGRATGSISGLSSNLVFYLVSGNDGFLLQNDGNTAIAGQVSKQQ